MTRSYAAYKANATRRARKDFSEAYPFSAEAVKLLHKGKTTQEVSDELWIDEKSVAAILANLHRYGQFRQMAEECNF